MTARPTKQDADDALDIAAEWLGDGTIVWHDWEAILAAEVRALREELEYARQTEHHIEGALEARDKWHKIANEQRAEVERLEAENDRLRRDRAEALNVTSRDGLLSSEWLARTGKAEATIARVEALIPKWDGQSKEKLAQIAFRAMGTAFARGAAFALEATADDLRKALRGEP